MRVGGITSLQRGRLMFIEKQRWEMYLPARVKFEIQGCPRSPRGRSFPLRLGLFCLIAVVLSGPYGLSAGPSVEGITFAASPGEFYVPLAEAVRLLDWTARWDEKDARLCPNKRSMPAKPMRRLVDGTALVSMTDLETAGALLVSEPGGCGVHVWGSGHDFIVIPGEKRVEISLHGQNLKAWQGQRLVLDCRISSGRRGSTPAGNFRAGPYKARMHYSSRYDNAPMPWSVQIHGHVFIHGFRSVPRYPASHGCIRLPLSEGNPAKFFFEWIDCGTPVSVQALATGPDRMNAGASP